MSTTNTNENVSKSTIKIKPFHQLFNSYLAVIFIVVSAGLISMCWLISEQSKYSQILLSEKLTPIQSQLIEQKYLIATNQLIEKLLNEANFIELKSLLNTLTMQSKKLSLLNSEYQNTYKQWLINNNAAINFLSDVEAKHPNNELLKSNMLILLDTLIDAIDIELKDGTILRKQKLILNKAQNHLMAIVLKLKSLNLKSSLSDFLKLSTETNALFTEDYGKQLANQKNDNDKIEEIVKDFLRLEDLIVKRGMLSRWEKQLELIDNNQRNIVEQQESLIRILEELSNKPLANISSIDGKTTNNSVFLLPMEVVALCFFTLLTLLTLLFLLSHRIKSANKFNVNGISEAIKGNENATKILGVNVKSNPFSLETVQLIGNIEAVRDQVISQAEHLSLLTKNQELKEQLENKSINYEKLYEEFSTVESNKVTESRISQNSLNNLHAAAIKQLIHFANGAIDPILSHSVRSEALDCTNMKRKYSHFYKVFLQGIELVRTLEKMHYHYYLRSETAVLTFTDVDIAAQIQAQLFNCCSELSLLKNIVTLIIDENINANVSIDAELFSEMFNAFIYLSFAQQTDCHLILNISLADKNTGQQELSFVSQVILEAISEKDNIEKSNSTEESNSSEANSGHCLPEALIDFNDDNESSNELINYFKLLSRYQHATKLIANVNDQGYRLGFTLPVAITHTKAENNYLQLTLPISSEELIQRWQDIAIEYMVMPIEVLLAVEDPVKYQNLQQMLNAAGLKTIFVTIRRQLTTMWQSGRYPLLITDMECQPFVKFMINEQPNSSTVIDMPRGVFSLTNATFVRPEAYLHWESGQLKVDCNIDELTDMLKPWLKPVENTATTTEIDFQAASLNLASESTTLEDIEKATPLKRCFDFDRYIKHQGSIELAIFMLEEYTLENTALVEQFSEAFYTNDMPLLEMTIYKIKLNSEILGADDLMALCQGWQKTFSLGLFDNTDKTQVNLLSNTQRAIKALTQDAEAIT